MPLGVPRESDAVRRRLALMEKYGRKSEPVSASDWRVICSDGSVWYLSDGEWRELPPVPYSVRWYDTMEAA